jgi:LmeA-like phospholipid-binding
LLQGSNVSQNQESAMLGGLIGSKESAPTDFGEKLLNTVASKSIAHLFSESESVEVQVRCYPSSKLLQGSIDSFKMQGKGLVIRRQFPVEVMSFETDAVALDFGSALQGQIRLKQSVQAIAQVVLSEAGINQAFEAELVQKRLVDISNPELDALSGEEPISFTNVKVQLLANNQVHLRAQAELPFHGQIPIDVITTLTVERRRRIGFSQPQFQQVAPENQAISERLSEAFVNILNGMVDLDRFDLDGVTMRINRLETEAQKLIFSGYAQIDHFPKAGG